MFVKAFVTMLMVLFLLAGERNYSAVEPYQQRQKSFSFGSHPVLQADVLEMDLQVAETRTQDHDFSRDRSVAEVVGQDLAIYNRFFPQSWIEVSNQFKLGFSKSHQIEQGFFDDETEDKWHQLQRAQVALKDQAQRVQFKIYEQYKQEFHGDRDVPESRLRLGAEADLRLSQKLMFSPSWWQEEHWIPERDRGHLEEWGARLRWDAMNNLAFSPEAAEQRYVLSNGQVRKKQRIGLGLIKTLPKTGLTWRTIPGYEEQFVEVGHVGNHRIHKVDSSISWNPNKQWALRSGGKVEHQEQYVRETEQTIETVYSEVKHSPIDELTLRLRGDYRLTESSQENRPDLDQRDSKMKVSLSPELQLNEHLFASARYLFEYFDSGSLEHDQQEQILTFSLHGQF